MKDAEKIINMNRLNLNKVIRVIDDCRAAGKISPDQAVCGKVIIASYVGEANDAVTNMTDITEMTTAVIQLDRKICAKLEKMKIYDDYLLA